MNELRSGEAARVFDYVKRKQIDLGKHTHIVPWIASGESKPIKKKEHLGAVGADYKQSERSVRKADNCDAKGLSCVPLDERLALSVKQWMNKSIANALDVPPPFNSSSSSSSSSQSLGAKTKLARKPNKTSSGRWEHDADDSSDVPSSNTFYFSSKFRDPLLQGTKRNHLPRAPLPRKGVRVAPNNGVEVNERKSRLLAPAKPLHVDVGGYEEKGGEVENNDEVIDAIGGEDWLDFEGKKEEVLSGSNNVENIGQGKSLGHSSRTLDDKELWWSRVLQKKSVAESEGVLQALQSLVRHKK